MIMGKNQCYNPILYWYLLKFTIYCWSIFQALLHWQFILILQLLWCWYSSRHRDDHTAHLLQLGVTQPVYWTWGQSGDSQSTAQTETLQVSGDYSVYGIKCVTGVCPQIQLGSEDALYLHVMVHQWHAVVRNKTCMHKLVFLWNTKSLNVVHMYR